MIHGFIKTSYVDFPGRLCSTVFIGGCNLRCHYCHNPEIVEMGTEKLSSTAVLSHLKKRKGVVDAVCITGGEPTLWEGLPLFISQIKEAGLLVKLDTNGTRPGVLRQLLGGKLLDYIAMDVKAPLQKYRNIVGADVDAGVIKQSIIEIMKSGIDYEFRLTAHSAYLSREDILSVANLLSGAKRLCLQAFRPREKLLNNACSRDNKLDEPALTQIRNEILKAGHVGEVIVR